jgi:hypothetical protein
MGGVEYMKINLAWHALHKLPKEATLNERINWHLEHIKNCSCRTKLHSGIADEIKRYIDRDKDFKFNI